jgi:hypothetical protein
VEGRSSALGTLLEAVVVEAPCTVVLYQQGFLPVDLQLESHELPFRYIEVCSGIAYCSLRDLVMGNRSFRMENHQLKLFNTTIKDLNDELVIPSGSGTW